MTLLPRPKSARTKLFRAAGAALALLGFAATAAVSFPASAADPIKVGLVAALSGQSPRAGDAIVRGLTVAIHEMNAKRGVLGRQIERVRRDGAGNPDKGLVAER